MRSWRTLAFACLAACVCGMAPARAETGTALVLAVVPQFPALDLHRTWTPIAKAIEASTGRPVRLKLHTSIPAFEDDVLAGTPQLAYMNP